MLFKNHLILTLLFLSFGIKAGPGSSILTYRRETVTVFSTVNNGELRDPNNIQDLQQMDPNRQAMDANHQVYVNQLRHPNVRRDDLRRMVLDNRALQQQRMMILDNPQRWAMALANAPQNEQRVFYPRGNR